jgi:peptidoglycan/xylan/chitin deacetylase (PgdA/CDA1 family)
MVISIIGIILFLAWLVIYPGTDYYTRLCDSSVLKRGNPGQWKLHLSFDDGPDPDYTPFVLQVLRENQIKASFFLIGRKAERHSELVAQILSAGHEIGIHTYHHCHAYRMFAKKSWTTVNDGCRSLQALTGSPPTWFRPPWGAANLFERWAAKRNGMKLVLWTANAQDWLLKTSPRMIVERLARQVKPGVLIVLHDSGGEPGAPAQMLQALPETIRNLKAAGYRFVSLSELNQT